jgi:CubicO group peptidase (beta-lactamase class C family)
MQLQEQGKLRIDDYAVAYLPWLKDHTDKRWRKVTLRQLMSHGAGVIRDGLDADYWQLERPFPNEKELRGEIMKTDLVIEANTKLKYSNFGYSLLGLVIKSVSGMSYNDYVTEHIVKPLGLENTGPEYDPMLEDKFVTGYSLRSTQGVRLPIAQVDTHAMASATGFYSTAEDMAKYFSAQFVGSQKLLDDESKKEMQRSHWHAKTPGQDNYEDYGLGIEIEYLEGRTTISHGGGFPGQVTKSIADPKDELVVVVLTNCLSGPAGLIAKSIYHILDYFQNNTPSSQPKHDLSMLEGRYMNLWAMTDFVVMGDRVVASYSDTWQPLRQPEVLGYVDDTTLKVIDTGSFDSEGELVHFNLKNGSVESINYCGNTMWPEKIWLDRISKKKIIG